MSDGILERFFVIKCEQFCSFRVKVCVHVINQIEMKVQTTHAMPSYQND